MSRRARREVVRESRLGGEVVDMFSVCLGVLFICGFWKVWCEV